VQHARATHSLPQLFSYHFSKSLQFFSFRRLVFGILFAFSYFSVHCSHCLYFSSVGLRRCRLLGHWPFHSDRTSATGSDSVSQETFFSSITIHEPLAQPRARAVPVLSLRLWPRKNAPLANEMSPGTALSDLVQDRLRYS